MINFCEISQEHLLKLLEFLGEKDVTDNSKMYETYVEGKCIKKEWEWYSTVRVTPAEIVAIGEVKQYLMTSERFEAMTNLVELLTKKP